MPRHSPPRPRLGVLAVGDEVLRGDVVDTNGALLARWAQDAGLAPGPRAVVGDDVRAIAASLRHLMRSCRVVAVLGGLGPTPDDVTREGVARFLDRPLEVREDLLEGLAALYARRGMHLSDAARRMAELPAGARAIPNEVGTAPGFWAEWRPAGAPADGLSRYVVVLPGPPRELRPMRDAVDGLLREWFPRVAVPPVRILQVAGYGESAIADRVARALGAQAALPGARLDARHEAAGVRFATYLRAGAVEVRLWASPGEEAALEEAAAAAREALGGWVYATDEPGLAPAIARIAEGRGLTIAVAESCTAGMVASQLAAVPGASRWFAGGIVAYAEAAKEELLAVPRDTLRRDGAVSAATAEAMARGALARFRADLAVSVTCFAGPGGGDEGTPVGTTFLGWADGTASGHWRRTYHGPRASVRERAAWEALVLLWARLNGLAPEP